MEYDAVIENDVLEEFLRTCKKKAYIRWNKAAHKIELRLG